MEKATLHADWLKIRRNAVELLLLILALVVLLGACSGTNRQSEASMPFAAADEAAPGDTGGAEELAAEAALVEQGAAPSVQRKVIARANLQLVVADTEAVVDSVNTLMDEVGGYVSNANLYKRSYSGFDLLQGTLTLRVPAGELENVLDRLEALAVEVETKTIDREDVTDQYSDIEAQLRNLEATEAELRELLAEVRAKPNATPEDILAVFRSLTEIRGQIEQLQGRKNMLDNLIGLSTIELTLVPDAVNRPVVEEGWRPVVVGREALRTLVTALQGLGSVLIWVVVFLLPLALLALLALAILFWIVRGIFRWLGRRSTARKLAEGGAPASD